MLIGHFYSYKLSMSFSYFLLRCVCVLSNIYCRLKFGKNNTSGEESGKHWHELSCKSRGDRRPGRVASVHLCAPWRFLRRCRLVLTPHCEPCGLGSRSCSFLMAGVQGASQGGVVPDLEVQASSCRDLSRLGRERVGGMRKEGCSQLCGCQTHTAADVVP